MKELVFPLFFEREIPKLSGAFRHSHVDRSLHNHY